ncbi:MAG: cyclopropane-fatty-acyl-phospholipid synthase family protein, partial [Pseudomonadota bacterium]
MIDALIERVLVKTFGLLVRRGSLSVVLPGGKVLQFGDRTTPHARIRFTDRRAIAKLLMDPDLQLGELFMDERLVMEEGTVYDLLELFLRDSQDVKPHVTLRLADGMRMGLRHWLQRNLPAKAQRNVSHHYDLGDPLYGYFLDADRQYSCAYFETPDLTLEQAQLAKKRHIAAKLLIEPGQRVLDIGCGWGGMARYLASVGGAGQVTGITLSQEQLAYAKAQSAGPAYAGKLEFRLEDYRATPGRFDRIVSVGMFEHVGLGFHDIFFKKCHDLLTDDGVMLLHFIGNCETPDFNNPWIEKYIFPGGHIPTLSECTPAIERSGLVVTDIEILRLHYASTLREWRRRFFAHREEIKALYDERFCKMWEFYLSMSETAFRYQEIAIFQIQLARRQENVPLTRDYMAGQKA